ncbi:LOW QUALITY PROTEIN: DUF1348-domain-containing protein [Colletotrichum tofieldiae]|nr:LOW QUALITY PROTEIN: DUF1348-domain-containing protein [Colletotrichum tofieldiae]
MSNQEEPRPPSRPSPKKRRKPRDPAKVKLAYTSDSIWRNRDTFLQGREQIEQWLTKKWEKEDGYRLRKELFAFTDNKRPLLAKSAALERLRTWLTIHQIAVQFWYEWHDESGQWWRTYGLEDWTFAENGLMRKRQMSGNDVKIEGTQRWFRDGVDVNAVAITEEHW